MAKLPPQPMGVPPGSSYWNDWYEKLRTFVEQITTSVDWSIITGKPTTLAGYGITDGQSKITSSADLAAAIGDETGTGQVVFNSSPSLVNPNIGTAFGTSLALTGSMSGVNAVMSGNISGVDLTTTGNTVLGNAAADTVNMGAGGFIKTATNQIGINCTPIAAVSFRVENSGNADVGFEWIRTSATVGTLTSYNRNGAAFTTMGFNGLNYTWQTGGGLAAQLANNGQFSLEVVGRGFSIKEGANAKMGATALVAGTVVINTTAVTANSRIMLSGQNTSGTAGELTVSARVAGTSFTITSSSVADTRTIAWILFEPS